MQSKRRWLPGWQRVELVLKVLGEHGAPPYLVRWSDGHESEVFPGSDIFVQHLGDSEEQ